jgi:prepilin-type N-terminal cleavage/methylation domain-containing protein
MKAARAGFSLVEVLVAVALIGVIVFLAIPNIVQVKDDSETHLAIARAEALNLATASYVQARGKAVANTAWVAAGNDPARYTLAAPYLSFAPATLALYVPGGYGMDLPDTVLTLQKVALTKGGTAVGY